MSSRTESTPPESFSEWRRLTPDEMKRRRFILIGMTLIALGIVTWFIPPVWQLKSGTVTVTRWQRVKGETEAVVGPGQRGWTSSKRISRHALHAIVAAEDGRFYQHFGLDPAEMWASFQTNLKRKRFARGGSTITQQVVKMAFLGREKTLLRKVREATGAVLLELIMPKEQILEWYINLAEFGDGVYSVADGAWHYFKTKPELLSIEQSVHMALVLPSPNGWSGGLRRGRLTPFGSRRFAAILNRMRQSGYITKTQWLTAITRGDFGRPVAGYTQLVQAEKKSEMLCPGNPGCPETQEDLDEPIDEDTDELSFPRTATKTKSELDENQSTLDGAATSPDTSSADASGAEVIEEQTSKPAPAQEPPATIPESDSELDAESVDPALAPATP